MTALSIIICVFSFPVAVSIQFLYSKKLPNKVTPNAEFSVTSSRRQCARLSSYLQSPALLYRQESGECGIIENIVLDNTTWITAPGFIYMEDTGNCPDDYQFMFSGSTRKCLKYYHISKDYNDAVTACNTDQGYLVKIGTAVDNFLVMEYISFIESSTGIAVATVRIGLHLVAYPGMFKWHDGTPMNETFTNWSKGEPGNKNTACAFIRKLSGFKWVDVRADLARPFMCEYPLI